VQIWQGESHFFKNGIWQMSASLGESLQNVLAIAGESGKSRKRSWRMLVSLANVAESGESQIFLKKAIFGECEYSLNSLNSLNSPNLSNVEKMILWWCFLSKMAFGECW
jgi:hypothetical protein